MVMKSIVLFFVITQLLLINSFSQDFIFFDDSPTSDSYDPSWGFVNSPSVLKRIGDKFPVEDSIKFMGINSLELSWRSVTNGDWGIAVAEPGWPGHDVTTKDFLTFWLYSETGISSINLPKVYLEDLSNVKTTSQKISDFSDDIIANNWTKIKIPINVFLDNPGLADLKQIKTIFFGQEVADGVQHTLYIDEIRIVNENENDTIPPAIPKLLYAKGFYKHIDIKWEKNKEEDLHGYYIYKIKNGLPELISYVGKNEMYYADFIGKIDSTCTYSISAIDISGNESELSNTVTASTKFMDDDELLSMLQECTFRYFWDYAHPTSCLIRERLGSGNTVTSGGTGMGVMAIIVGIERKFIARSEGAERILRIVRFLKNADRFNGAWSHWINGETGKVIPFSQFDNGGDLVETAYLIAGLLVARAYFDRNNDTENEIRLLTNQLWEEVEWDWYRKTENSSVLYWHWSPEYNWQINLPIQGYNEAMITYLLAIASPSHPIPPDFYYKGWVGNNYLNGKSFYGIKLDIGPDYGGPLFFTHYSFLSFDPRNKRDKYVNYFEYARNVALVHQQYSIDNPKDFIGYNNNTWGLTASDDPLLGYAVHSPMYNDNGTITPSAAISSFPFTPVESMAAFKNFYTNYGEILWGKYGFKDAFNPTLGWTAGSYIAIDQAPTIIMIENYRTNLIWNLFMSNSEIKSMLNAIGFEVVNGINNDKEQFNLNFYNNYPNPFNPDTIIEFSLPTEMYVELNIFDVLGHKIELLVKEKLKPGKHKVKWEAKNLASGVYFSVLQAGEKSETIKMILLH